MKTAASFLTKTTRQWINKVISEWELEERHIRLLNLAGECWDRLCEIRTVIKDDGCVLEDRFKQKKPHPLLQEERAQKKLFAQLIREIGFDLEAEEIPRIPKLTGGLYATKENQGKRKTG